MGDSCPRIVFLHASDGACSFRVGMGMKAFLYGVLEFRSDFTRNFGDNQMAYEWGREWAHRITLRHYEN